MQEIYSGKNQIICQKQVTNKKISFFRSIPFCHQTLITSSVTVTVIFITLTVILKYIVL